MLGGVASCRNNLRVVSENDVTYIGRANHRNIGALFGIKRRDRRSHVVVLGKTGTGKSHLLQTMFLQDVAAGEGCCLLDPHGDLCLSIRRLIPAHRKADVIYIDPSEKSSEWRFNPLHGIAQDRRAFAVAGMIEVFKKLWPDEWGPRLEHLLRNVIFSLVEIPASTLGDVPRLLSDRTYRSRVVTAVENEVVRRFWSEEFDRYSPGFRSVVVAPLQNKVGAFLTDPVPRRFLTEPGQQLDLRAIMDSRRIVIVNLGKGRLGEGPSSLLGSLVLSSIALSATTRADTDERNRADFWTYVDEAQTFTTLAFATMFTELRKFRVGVTLCHQHTSQLDTAVRDAIFGNAGTILAFRTGASDGGFLAREFAPIFSESDFTGLPRYSLYLRLLIDGEPSRPFSASTLSSLDEIPQRR